MVVLSGLSRVLSLILKFVAEGCNLEYTPMENRVFWMVRCVCLL